MLVKGFYRQIIIGLIPFQNPLEDYFAPFTSKYTQKIIIKTPQKHFKNEWC